MPSKPAVRIALLFGVPVLLGLLSQAAPPWGLTQSGWCVALVALLMATWWMTEIVPLAITALIPVLALPVLGVLPIDDVAASYAHPLIFLFLGGFLLARAMEYWGLHRRLAVSVMRAGGKGPAQILASLMAVTAFLSLWISNTATAMVMLPIGAAVASVLSGAAEKTARVETGIGAAVMLGIAYAATIGGMGSLIGTPPNALFAGFMKSAYGVEIGFARWMIVGLPVVLVLLPLTWVLLAKIMFRLPNEPVSLQSSGLIGESRTPMKVGEKRVALLMALVAGLWVLRPLLEYLFGGLQLSDAGIAVFGALLLFVVPSDLGKGEYLIDWREAVKIRWDILILFGGGLALANAIGVSGLAAAIGAVAEAQAHLLMPLLLIAAASVAVVLLGELASNTAIAAVFLPIAGAVAVGVGADPISLALPITLAASLGFMLPVATPPNAIVFGSGAVSANQMLRVGAVLDVLSIVVVLALGSVLVPLAFPAP